VVNAPRGSWLRSGAVATFIWDVSEHMPWLPGVSLPVRVGILAAEVAVATLLFLAIAQRYVLRMLLTDKSWLYNARSPTLWNKVWFVLVRWLTSRRPLTYTFQSSLPALPVPDLNDTVDKYLESARLLQSGAELEATEKAAEVFRRNEGPKLQWYLRLKSWLSPNYVADWWEKYVYLRGRSSIAINSNYYVLDGGRWHPTKVQEARAAVLIYAMMRYKEQLAAEQIEPVMAADGAVPLCMWQFERVFSTARIPGRECDEIKHWDPSYSRHVVVYCKGSFYRLNVHRPDGSLRTPDELFEALRNLKLDASARKPREAEACIPALTAENRTRWAEIRESYFSEGLNNRRSLHAIESALMFVVLSDECFDTLDWTGRGKYLLCADREQPNIWFDKSINLVVFGDGKSGMNCEHAWADAPTAAHVFELSMIIAETEMDPYEPETGLLKKGLWPRAPGCTNTRSGSDDTWSVLNWSLSRDAEDAVLAAREHLRGMTDDLDLQTVAFSDYGKDFVKRCRVSPDAYVQMAMQLAYFRDQGHFDATYESSMTRLFLHGRTGASRVWLAPWLPSPSLWLMCAACCCCCFCPDRLLCQLPGLLASCCRLVPAATLLQPPRLRLRIAPCASLVQKRCAPAPRSPASSCARWSPRTPPRTTSSRRCRRPQPATFAATATP